MLDIEKIISNRCTDIIKERKVVTPKHCADKVKNMLIDENLELLADCVVIIVIKDDKTLLGYRSDGQGWSSAGGAVELNEGIEQAAKRELQEEFGIEATKLVYMGRHWATSHLKGKEKIVIYPAVFLCTEFAGLAERETEEMGSIKWVDINELGSINMFEATRVIYEGIFGA